MKFSEIKQKIERVKNEYCELRDFELRKSERVTDVCFLTIRDNMLSKIFLKFLLLNFDFAIFPSYDDKYRYDIQIVCD